MNNDFFSTTTELSSDRVSYSTQDMVASDSVTALWPTIGTTGRPSRAQGGVKTTDDHVLMMRRNCLNGKQVEQPKTCVKDTLLSKPYASQRHENLWKDSFMFSGHTEALKRHPHPPPLSQCTLSRRVCPPLRKTEKPVTSTSAFQNAFQSCLSSKTLDGSTDTTSVLLSSLNTNNAVTSSLGSPSKASNTVSNVSLKHSSSVSSNEEHIADHTTQHQLHSAWCFYVLQNAGRRNEESWKDNQVKVFEFSTVEDFWGMFHDMHLPSRIGVFDYSLFRRGIAPAWEDPSLVQGGRWVAKFPHRMELLNVIWLHTAMAVIGETLCEDHSEVISGVVVSLRPRFLKLALWIAVREPCIVDAIGKQFQRLLASVLLTDVVTQETEFVFQSFRDNIERKLSLPSETEQNDKQFICPMHQR